MTSWKLTQSLIQNFFLENENVLTLAAAARAIKENEQIERHSSLKDKKNWK